MNRFPKSQRLCSHTLIDQMFMPGNSKSITAYPLRLVYRTIPSEQPELGHQQKALLISVPKRCFKHAVDRNRVKRQIREAYRTDRDTLKLPEGTSIHLAMIWLDSKHHPSATVASKVHNLLVRASEKICGQ